MNGQASLRAHLTGSLILAVLPLLAGRPAAATTYVPVPDEALVEQAPVIAVVRVLGSQPALDGGRPATDYGVRVERGLKGALPGGSEITVRVPGGVLPDGLGLKIWGAPRLAPGERALLFLVPRRDGSYTLLHLMLGAFHEVRTSAGRLALRHLSEASAAAPPGERLAAEPLRSFDRFVRWIAHRVRGVRSPAGYEIPAPGDLGQISEEFTLFRGADGYSLRWPSFDQGNSVDWYIHQDGQPGLAGGGFAEIWTALTAWNNDTTTNIAYRYAGATISTNGLRFYDAVNSIVFDQDLFSPFSCSSGGLLAQGGTWFLPFAESQRGALYHRILYADVATNQGIGCFFQASPHPSKTAEEIFAHELGHTLGLGHSCGDAGSGACSTADRNDALMRATLHNDGRGASLGSDDKAAIAALYSPPSARFFTLPPCRLVDTRNLPGEYGAPRLAAGQPRIFAAAGQCGIPSTAVALAANVTAVSPSAAGSLTIYPTDQAQPVTSNLSFPAGRNRSSHSILVLSRTPERGFKVALLSAAGTDLVVDVSGYFE